MSRFLDLGFLRGSSMKLMFPYHVFAHRLCDEKTGLGMAAEYNYDGFQHLCESENEVADLLEFPACVHEVKTVNVCGSGSLSEKGNVSIIRLPILLCVMIVEWICNECWHRRWLHVGSMFATFPILFRHRCVDDLLMVVF